MNVLATIVLLAAEGGASGISTILPAPPELVYGLISFVLFYLVMRKFAFPQLNDVLEARAESIQGRMEEAEQQLNEAREIKANYEEQLSDAKSQANRIIDEAKETAESLRSDIVAKAESEAESIVERAHSEVQAERERTVQQLRSEVGRLSVQLAEKIVEKELDESAHRSLVDRYISNLAGNGNGASPSGGAQPSGGGVATAEREGSSPDQPGGATGGGTTGGGREGGAFGGGSEPGNGGPDDGGSADR